MDIVARKQNLRLQKMEGILSILKKMCMTYFSVLLKNDSLTDNTNKHHHSTHSQSQIITLPNVSLGPPKCDVQVLDREWRDVFQRCHRIQLLVLATEEWAYILMGKRKGNKEITK